MVRLERITDPEAIDPATIEALASRGIRPVLQFSKPGVSDRVLDKGAFPVACASVLSTREGGSKMRVSASGCDNSVTPNSSQDPTPPRVEVE